MGGRAGAEAVGLAARAGVAGGWVCTLWQELRVLERAPAGIGARLLCTLRRAVPSWGGLPWEPNLVTAR